MTKKIDYGSSLDVSYLMSHISSVVSYLMNYPIFRWLSNETEHEI